jgi:hypothetical protein
MLYLPLCSTSKTPKHKGEKHMKWAERGGGGGKKRGGRRNEPKKCEKLAYHVFSAHGKCCLFIVCSVSSQFLKKQQGGIFYHLVFQSPKIYY